MYFLTILFLYLPGTISTPVNFGALSNVEIKILGNIALPESISCELLDFHQLFAGQTHFWVCQQMSKV